MATRKKLYYSEVEIEKNLVTNGKQWMLLENWEEYIGYYHSYSSTREVYTEKEWHPKKSKVLVPFKEKPKSYFNYIDLVSYTRDSGEKRRFSGPSRYDNFKPRLCSQNTNPERVTRRYNGKIFSNKTK